MKIAVDFDGTGVDHQYPEVGMDAPLAVATLKDLIKAGHGISSHCGGRTHHKRPRFALWLSGWFRVAGCGIVSKKGSFPFFSRI